MTRPKHELEVLAAVGELVVSQLKGHDEVARAIFAALAPQFEHREYPYLKTLTHIVLQHVQEADESKEAIIARLSGNHGPSIER